MADVRSLPSLDVSGQRRGISTVGSVEQFTSGKIAIRTFNAKGIEEMYASYVTSTLHM